MTLVYPSGELSIFDGFGQQRLMISLSFFLESAVECTFLPMTHVSFLAVPLFRRLFRLQVTRTLCIEIDRLSSLLMMYFNQSPMGSVNTDNVSQVESRH